MYNVTLWHFRVTLVAEEKLLSVTITSLCVCILALVSLRRIILSSVARPALPYFSTLSQKRYNLRGGGLYWTQNCVFWLSLQLLSETFLILTRIQRGIIINVQRPSCEETVILQSLIKLTFSWQIFKKILKCQISLKSVQWESGCSMLMDKQTDRHMMQLIVTFHNFVNAPKNMRRQLLSHVQYNMLTYGEMEL